MSETVGAALRAARERRQLTLAQVSEITKVRGHYLQALENDDISAMPSAAQARGFLRIYAEFLDLELAKLIPPAAPLPAIGESAEPPAKESPAALGQMPRFISALRDRLAARRPRREGPSPADETPGRPAEAVPTGPPTETGKSDTSDSGKKKLT